MSLRSPLSPARRTGLAAVAGALLVSAVSAPAWAIPGQTSTDSTVARVVVESAINLTGLTEDFTLTGIPGATVTGAAAVGFNVATNNFAGYTVTVQARNDVLSPVTTGNPDTIPVSALRVRGDGTNGYVPVTNAAPVLVHTQPTRSALGGDDLTNDYQMTIPFVNEDTYAVTLDYVATTL